MQLCSSELGALQIQEHGFNLTKTEFQDTLDIRYNRNIKNLPSQCPCGRPFTTTHVLDYHFGAFINARHDRIRDFENSLLKSVSNDVEVEPAL